ncbi:hypothetical protein AB6A40_000735 [Gnathostoma spinigerum]|uniref:Acyltransferase 3 domain-containing protein n=1 Tax=Gnathostoma spinigerum TaxID=75299 RepID=A0ABD6E4R8_9BILA
MSSSVVISACLIALVAAVDNSSIVNKEENKNFPYLLDEIQQMGSISNHCRTSVKKVLQFLEIHLNGSLQKELYLSSLDSDKYIDFVGQHQFHWMAKLRFCQSVPKMTVYSKSQNPTSFCYGPLYGNDSTMVTGICLPSTCEVDKQKIMNLWRNMMNINESVNNADSISCIQSQYEYQWSETFSGLFNLAFPFITLLTVGILATIFDFLRNDYPMSKSSIAMKVFLSFSWYRNVPKSINPPHKESGAIMCLFGLRAIGMLWVVTGHSFALLQTYMNDTKRYETDTTVWYNQWISNATLSVDVFLVIGGTLNAFLWFKTVKKFGRNRTCLSLNFWLIYYLARVLRLWPAYIVSMVDYMYRMGVSGLSPPWDLYNPNIQCRTDWWKNLLFINSIVEDGCMPWTWYISLDFILYAVAPAFLLPLFFNGIVGYCVCLIAIVVSSLFNLFAMLEYKFPPVLIVFMDAPQYYSNDLARQNSLLYMRPECRAGPYIVGIMLGYHLSQLDRNTINSISRRFRFVGWILFSFLGIVIINGTYPILNGWNCLIYDLLYGSVHRTLFGVFLAWIIYACHTVSNSWLSRALSIRPFIWISNLGFSIYLSHILGIESIFILSSLPIVYDGVTTMMIRVFAQFLSSCFFSVCLFYNVELPASNIVRIFLRR